MKRVIVIGCSGSGKSYFSKKLGEVTGLPLIHLDLIWHKADRTTVTKEEFDTRLSEIMEGERWILDGNFSRTMEARMKMCDTVFLFDLPLDACIAGVEGRIGKPRDDMPWVETEFDPEFKSWIESFRETRLPRMYELLEKYKDRVNVIIFKSRLDAEKYLEGLKNVI